MLPFHSCCQPTSFVPLELGVLSSTMWPLKALPMDVNKGEKKALALVTDIFVHSGSSVQQIAFHLFCFNYDCCHRIRTLLHRGDTPPLNRFVEFLQLYLYLGVKLLQLWEINCEPRHLFPSPLETLRGLLACARGGESPLLRPFQTSVTISSGKRQHVRAFFLPATASLGVCLAPPCARGRQIQELSARILKNAPGHHLLPWRSHLSWSR